MTIPFSDLLKPAPTFSGAWDETREKDPFYRDHVSDRGHWLRGHCTCRMLERPEGGRIKVYVCSNAWKGLCIRQAQVCGGMCPECFKRAGELSNYLATGLNLALLRVINAARCRRWHGADSTYAGTPPRSTQWSGADWATAMGGECGEAQNVVKKLRRGESGTPSARDPGRDELLLELGDELADTLLYADLLANYYGIDLSEAIVRKFNAVSEREEFPERL